jgi:hypothetical protein
MNLAFPGHAFHPSVPTSGGLIFFELVADGHSRIASFDPKTKVLERLTPEAADAHNPAVSPDGNKLAYISGEKLFVHGEGPLLTPAPVEDAAWFPRGNHLAFSAGGAIYDSSRMRPLASFVPGDHSDPAVCCSQAAVRTSCWSVQVNGTAERVSNGGVSFAVVARELSLKCSTPCHSGACRNAMSTFATIPKTPAFRADALRHIALDWCEENQIVWQ